MSSIQESKIILKSKKNQLNKALKDIKILGNFSPDNLQIAAMKVEI